MDKEACTDSWKTSIKILWHCPFSGLIDSTWAPYEQAKTFCQIFPFHDLRGLLTSFIKKAGMSESFVFLFKRTKKHTKRPKNTIFVNFFWAKHSFFVSERTNERFAKKTERFANSLIYYERPEWITHAHSFDMSDLSDLLTVTHLSWAIWANRSQSLIWSEWSERMSKWTMSKWANSQPWGPCWHCVSIVNDYKDMCQCSQ